MWIQCMECCTAHLFVEFSILNKSCATHHMQDISSVIGNTNIQPCHLRTAFIVSIFGLVVFKVPQNNNFFFGCEITYFYSRHPSRKSHLPRYVSVQLWLCFLGQQSLKHTVQCKQKYSYYLMLNERIM